MKSAARLICAVIAAASLAGCVNANVRVPEIPYGSAPPPATIVPADPNSSADLRRENDQLHQRVAWLENQNRKSQKKYDDLQRDMSEVRNDTDKIAAERDRYRRAIGQ